MEVHRRSDWPDAQVDDFDKHRETHRKVDMALRYLHTEAVADQRDANHQQQRQREDFTVGWRLAKELMGPAENIITPTARISYAFSTCDSRLKLLLPSSRLNP
jgi:hypothetical protein